MVCKNMKIKKYAVVFVSWFLLSFMLLLFGPTELFFGNATQFKFIVWDFLGWQAGLCVIATLVGAGLTCLLPERARLVVSGIVFAISLAGYIQIMFLNKGLDLLGMNPEGYSVSAGTVVPNLCLWLGILLIVSGMLVFLWWKKEIGEKIIGYLGGILVLVQCVAFISLLLSGNQEAFSRGEDDWHFTGAEQYTVSDKENVILLILDYFSNGYLPEELAQYPGATDFLHDFTYYSNADCTYFGTYPSLTHMLTGYEMNPTIPINEWFTQCWSNDKTTNFYEQVHKKGYKVNVYTEDSRLLRGTNEVSMLAGTISNVQDLTVYVEVNTKLLVKTMVKMSCYRFAPYALKPVFYTNMGEYADIVQAKDDQIRYQNYSFKEGLQEKGLTVDKDSNYFIVQHLMGVHEYNNTENGELSEEGTSREETIKGCLTVTECYLDALKEAGVYDNATIIITADHGGQEYPYYQPIFYVKRPNEHHEASPETTAPISHNDLLATYAVSMNLDADEYGYSIFDFEDGQERERTYWLRAMDSNYPANRCYCEDKEGTENVSRGYSYTGDLEELQKKILSGPDIVIEQKESFY